MSLLIRLAFSDHCFTFSYSTSCSTSVHKGLILLHPKHIYKGFVCIHVSHSSCSNRHQFVFTCVPLSQSSNPHIEFLFHHYRRRRARLARGRLHSIHPTSRVIHYIVILLS